MRYHGKNTIHMCLVGQNNPISLIGICVLYRRDPIPYSLFLDATLFPIPMTDPFGSSPHGAGWPEEILGQRPGQEQVCQW